MVAHKEQRIKLIDVKLASCKNNLVRERLLKLKALLEADIEPFPHKFPVNTSSVEILKKYDCLDKEEKTKDEYAIAGRIMSLRKMGKIAFLHIQDGFGKLQIYLAKDSLENYNKIKKFDIGDFIAVKGTVFKTRTGEVTIDASYFEMMAKSLHPLPEKFHGLKDVETIYRKRHLDLIMNPESKKKFQLRSKAITAVREYLDAKGFMEVEIPTLQPVYGGGAAKPFITHHNELDMDLYLSISPELYLKRLIVGGYDRVYTLCKNFRNEGIDTTHNPEFTMMECYGTYMDYNDMMELTENIYAHVLKKTHGTTKITYQGKELDFTPPWKRLTMVGALKEIGGVDVENMSDDELKELVKKHGIELPCGFTKGWAIQGLFEELAEDKLIQPTFIIDHPRESTPLCKVHRKNPELIERFEPFSCGMEIGNAYSELNDPIMQEYLFKEQEKNRDAGDDEAHPTDMDFVEAMEYGMPPTGGLGIGIDRLIMFVTDSASIRDIVFFPTMKPIEEDSDKKE